MADDARRSVQKVTYAPIKPSEEDIRNGSVGRRRRGLDKVAFAMALNASPAEIAAAQRGVRGRNRAEVAEIREALAAIGGVAARLNWGEIAKLSVDALAEAGRALARIRKARRTTLRAEARKLALDHAAFVRESLEAAAAPKPLLTASSVPRPAIPAAAEASAPAVASASLGPSAAAGAGPVDRRPRPGVETDPRLNAASLKPSFRQALDWARVHDPDRGDRLAALARNVVGTVGLFNDVRFADPDAVTDAVVETGTDNGAATDALVDGFVARVAAEWCGRLHLERIDMTPVGVQRGELMHAVGLAPKETITLIHREWSRRETSYERAVLEEFEQSKEDSVTEDTELASATETQSRHSTAFSMDVTASGSWGFASASATIGYETTSDEENVKSDSRNHSVSVTGKAASRARKEHKVTFTVKEEAGVEDETVRTLTNPSATEAMRIDFHQLLRKWKVELYRYGLRQTFDIVLPAPGIDLLAKVNEINRIDHILGQPFSFPVTPDEVTRDRWSALAAQYGGHVDPPPPAEISIQQVFDYQGAEPSVRAIRLDVFSFEVPSGYQVKGGDLAALILFFQFDPPDDDPQEQKPFWDVQLAAEPGVEASINTAHQGHSALAHLIGRTGRVDVAMASKMVRSGHVQARLDLVETGEAALAWRNRAWTQIREGAEERYRTSRQELRDRRDQLTAEIEQWDPLTLRRMEREEIMKLVLKWMLGPFSELWPSDIEALHSGGDGGMPVLDPATLTPEQWARVMERGELIKFLHQAIEWENVLFFIYPYFWDHRDNQRLKLFLRHPDSMHQTFLRGGAVRVVLTVRPGFEEEFSSFVETAVPEGIVDLDDNPYLTIAQEIRAFAKTNYPGIPGADETVDPSEEEIDDARRGKLIARWFEYTPVSALDISVNTPLDELR